MSLYESVEEESLSESDSDDESVEFVFIIAVTGGAHCQHQVAFF